MQFLQCYSASLHKGNENMKIYLIKDTDEFSKLFSLFKKIWPLYQHFSSSMSLKRLHNLKDDIIFMIKANFIFFVFLQAVS